MRRTYHGIPYRQRGRRDLPSQVAPGFTDATNDYTILRIEYFPDGEDGEARVCHIERRSWWLGHRREHSYIPCNEDGTHLTMIDDRGFRIGYFGTLQYAVTALVKQLEA